MKMNSRGQVTVPKKVRDILGLSIGSVIGFEIIGTGQVVLYPISVERQSVGRFAALRGRATVKMSADAVMGLTRGVRRYRFQDRPRK